MLALLRGLTQIAQRGARIDFVFVMLNLMAFFCCFIVAHYWRCSVDVSDAAFGFNEELETSGVRISGFNPIPE
jgi:hypothetical protein